MYRVDHGQSLVSHAVWAVCQIFINTFLLLQSYVFSWGVKQQALQMQALLS